MKSLQYVQFSLLRKGFPQFDFPALHLMSILYVAKERSSRMKKILVTGCNRMAYRHRFTYVLLLFVTFLSSLAFGNEDTVFNGWTHLELGAGNYGPDGHTKTSQAMTVLIKIKDVSNEKNYIDKATSFSCRKTSLSSGGKLKACSCDLLSLKT